MVVHSAEGPVDDVRVFARGAADQAADTKAAGNARRLESRLFYVSP